MWKSIATITLAILFSAYSSKQSQTMSQEEYQKLLSQTYMLTPDSLLTNDQIELKIKVMDFMMTNVDYWKTERPELEARLSR